MLPEITYGHELEPAVHTKVRARFHREIEALTALGFQELCFCTEQMGAFSGLLHLPLLLVMLAKREVLTLHRRLEASAAFILMGHSHPATIAVPMGLGVKLYTSFSDGTVLISTTFGSCLQPHAGSQVIKYSSKVPLSDAWALHQNRVRETEGPEKQVQRSLGFERYVEMSRLEETA